ncbi:YaeQ family protein [Bordetella genomosp. 9]|uniref:YaeQ family protein n=1 Tax=Bordetella genomosp. 9 TaxID=1416803 RepID=A0A1W6YZF3_9BORD|nr:YaeQ family protein [Bordetella genomosp. 9]ARP86470.1 hypothetical protein CAL13_09850 [Bordetella genomosp. 9]ARP90485.1 hypothetical protein CAL14_09430 [Bordetella genomosp. 9]
MALRATIYKADLNVADNDRRYYGNHALTVARHPSETDERMMVRILAYALNADEALAFTKGLSETDEPDIWRKDLTGAIDLWIEVGQPDERRILKACGRAAQVLVYCYGHASALWWQGVRDRVARARNLKVVYVPSEAAQALGALTQRTMSLDVNVQDGDAYVTGEAGSVVVTPETWRD